MFYIISKLRKNKIILTCISRLLIALISTVIPTVTFPETLSASTAYSWTGFYVGGSAGYTWGNANDSMSLQDLWLTDGTGDDILLMPYGNKQLKPAGFIGGIQVGFNYQIQHWLPGIVADVSFFSLEKKFSTDIFVNPASTNSYSFTSSFNGNWLVTLRPRLGYTFGSFLPYITAGLAIAHQQFSQTIQQWNLSFAESASSSNTRVGWTVGAGAEYALTSNWRLMLEYLYVDLDPVSLTSIGSLANVGPVDYSALHSAELNANIIRVGLIYVFH